MLKGFSCHFAVVFIALLRCRCRKENVYLIVISDYVRWDHTGKTSQNKKSQGTKRLETKRPQT